MSEPPTLPAGAETSESLALQAEIAERRRVEEDLRRSLEQADLSHRVLLRVLEDQKLSEEALGKSEALYRSLFENMLNGFAFCRMLFEDGQPRDFVYLAVNNAFEAQTGLKNVVGRKASEVIPGIRETDQAFLDICGRVALTGNSERFETYVRSLRMWLWVSLYCPSPEHFVAVFDVITERKLADIERDRLTTAIEQAAEMIFVTDVQGAIQYVNPAFETVTGYTRAEALGRKPSMLRSGVQDDAFYRALWETISAGKTWHGRMVNKKKNGTLYTEESTISPVRDATGVITSYVAVKRDMTRDLDLEAQLLQSQKMESIGRLAGGIAHDFNNCISVIQGFAHLGLDKVSEGDPLADDLEQVLKASERAATLTRQLLAFSRRQVLQPEVLDLNQVLGEMEKMLRRIIGENIEMVQVLAADLGLVKADPGQLGQAIMNLVVNARDAMPDGGKLTIATSNMELDAELAAQHGSVVPGPHVVIAVTDTGSGMDTQTMARIFEPFFTTKALGKGTGLGLSTVYGIAKQSGGNILVDSGVGKGTTFKLYLPRELSATQPAPTRPQPPLCRARGNETVLVVEDEAAVRLLTTRLLKKAGYRVLNAADGEQALLASEQHPGNIHLLLTDLVMPRLGGRLLAERLARLRPALKILYMSGYTDDAIVRHGVMDVRTQLLAKPFSEVELTRKVRAVLDGMLVTSGTNWPAIPEASEERPIAAPQALSQSDSAQPGRTAIDARHAGSGAIDVQGSKILVVDDSTDNLRLLTAVLKRGGLVPRPVTSGKLAIKAALADPPDLVLLDMRMPELSGVEVCHCFKQDERLCDIPIIFISGLQSSDDKVEAFHAGGADFVSKPFVEEEVLARIETHLRLRRLEIDLAARRYPPAALN